MPRVRAQPASCRSLLREHAVLVAAGALTLSLFVLFAFVAFSGVQSRSMAGAADRLLLSITDAPSALASWLSGVSVTGQAGASAYCGDGKRQAGEQCDGTMRACKTGGRTGTQYCDMTNSDPTKRCRWGECFIDTVLVVNLDGSCCGNGKLDETGTFWNVPSQSWNQCAPVEECDSVNGKEFYNTKPRCPKGTILRCVDCKSTCVLRKSECGDGEIDPVNSKGGTEACEFIDQYSFIFLGDRSPRDVCLEHGFFAGGARCKKDGESCVLDLVECCSAAQASHFFRCEGNAKRSICDDLVECPSGTQCERTGIGVGNVPVVDCVPLSTGEGSMPSGSGESSSEGQPTPESPSGTEEIVEGTAGIDYVQGQPFLRCTPACKDGKRCVAGTQGTPSGGQTYVGVCVCADAAKTLCRGDAKYSNCGETKVADCHADCISPQDIVTRTKCSADRHQILYPCGETHACPSPTLCAPGKGVGGLPDCISCGNGQRDAGEACDYTDIVSKSRNCGGSPPLYDPLRRPFQYGTATCKQDCTWELSGCGRCGDKSIQSPFESCDDGNTLETDACNNKCDWTRCGDSVVQNTAYAGVNRAGTKQGNGLTGFKEECEPGQFQTRSPSPGKYEVRTCRPDTSCIWGPWECRKRDCATMLKALGNLECSGGLLDDGCGGSLDCGCPPGKRCSNYGRCIDDPSAPPSSGGLPPPGSPGVVYASSQPNFGAGSDCQGASGPVPHGRVEGLKMCCNGVFQTLRQNDCRLPTMAPLCTSSGKTCQIADAGCPGFADCKVPQPGQQPFFLTGYGQSTTEGGGAYGAGTPAGLGTTYSSNTLVAVPAGGSAIINPPSMGGGITSCPPGTYASVATGTCGTLGASAPGSSIYQSGGFTTTPPSSGASGIAYSSPVGAAGAAAAADAVSLDAGTRVQTPSGTLICAEDANAVEYQEGLVVLEPGAAVFVEETTFVCTAPAPVGFWAWLADVFL